MTDPFVEANQWLSFYVSASHHIQVWFPMARSLLLPEQCGKPWILHIA